MTIGYRIKQARLAARLSQAALGKAVGVEGNTVSSWERDRTTPDRSLVPKIAKTLNVTQSYLEFGDSVDTVSDIIPLGPT